MLRIFYFQKGIILEERMCDTSMLEEKAMVQFMNRFTDYPFLVKWKDHEDRIGHGNPMFAVDIRETIPVKEADGQHLPGIRGSYDEGQAGGWRESV